MRIITIGREFGSGGRELGKRLADALGIPCYDKEIINEVAKLQGITTDMVEYITEADINSVYAGTIGRTFYSPVYFDTQAINILIEQTNVIKNIASKGDCVIVGCQADIILSDMNPLNIFVYANKESKLERCLSRSTTNETEKEILKKMKKIDKSRSASRTLMCGGKWGEKENYNLCLNTSNKDIKSLIPVLVQFVNEWFK